MVHLKIDNDHSIVPNYKNLEFPVFLNAVRPSTKQAKSNKMKFGDH